MNYYCYNCDSTFDRPKKSISPYPDYGGEPILLCPICLVPENFKETEEKIWHENE